MRYPKFLMLLVDKNIPVVADYWKTTKLKNTWSTHKKLAELTEHVDYKCDFKNGFCKAYRGESSSQPYPSYFFDDAPKEMCCCVQCAGSVGHHHTLPKSDIRRIAISYNSKTGFLENGCRLCTSKKTKVCKMLNIYLFFTQHVFKGQSFVNGF